MAKSFNRRLAALEQARKPTEAALPTLLPDDAPDSELERLRALGLVVYRFSDAVELFV